MKKLIRVTKSDIENGAPEESELCPVALAAKRCLKVRDDMCVERAILWYRNRWIKLPDEAVVFIHRFDRRQAVKPFKFFLNV